MKDEHSNEMNKKIISFIKYFFLLGVTFLLLVLAFKGVDLNSIFLEISRAKLSWIGLSAFFSTFALIIRAYRWKMLIESTGHPAPIMPTFYSMMVGYFANLAFPRLGEVTRCGSLSKAINVSFSKLLGTVIIERIIDVISLLICLLLTGVIEYKRLGNFLAERIIGPITNKIGQWLHSPLILTVGILFMSIGIGVISWYLKRSKKDGESSFLSKLVKGLVDGLRSISKLKQPRLFIFHSVFIWVLYFLAIYVCLFAFPFTADLGPGAALFLLVAGGLGMSAPVQGGIGTYHLLVSQGLMVYGISRQDGLAFATLVHSLSLIVVVIFGILSLILLFTGKKRNAWAYTYPKEDSSRNEP